MTNLPATAALVGKSAIATGSTSGIGLGIARLLVRQGANVLINELGSEEQSNAAIASASDAGSEKVVVSPCNTTRPAEITTMVQGAANTFGAVDILVNNAGTQIVSPIQDFPVDKWNEIIAVNLSSSFHTIRAATPPHQ